MSQTGFIKELVQGNIDALQTTFDDAHVSVLYEIIKVVYDAIKSGNKLLICGNGGSAADSQHIAAEFIGRFKKERKSYPAIALTTDTSALTAIGNDYSYEEVFSRQVEGLGQPGDVLIGISTSGNSGNVIRAMRVAKEIGMKTIVFTGKDGGKLKDECDLSFIAVSDNTPFIQCNHLVALHTMCECVENMLCEK